MEQEEREQDEGVQNILSDRWIHSDDEIHLPFVQSQEKGEQRDPSRIDPSIKSKK